jgi:hypothetical protein
MQPFSFLGEVARLELGDPGADLGDPADDLMSWMDLRSYRFAYQREFCPL